MTSTNSNKNKQAYLITDTPTTKGERRKRHICGRPMRLDQNKHRWGPDDSIRGRKSRRDEEEKDEGQKQTSGTISFIIVE
jgi:hypothetical protein